MDHPTAHIHFNYWTKLFIPGEKQKLVDAKVYAQKTYDEAILLAWPKICESLTLAKNDSKNWKRIMHVKRGGIPPPKVKHQNPEIKAAELADSFAQRTHSDNLSQKSFGHEKSVNPKSTQYP